MSNAFVTALDKVGDFIKEAFTNKTAEAIEETGLEIAEIAFPAASTLIGGIQKSLATAQALAAVNTTGDTTAQVAAITLGDAQAVFQEYEDATGTSIETVQQKSIIAAIIALFQQLPAASTSSTGATVTSASSVTNTPTITSNLTAGAPVSTFPSASAVTPTVAVQNANLL